MPSGGPEHYVCTSANTSSAAPRFFKEAFGFATRVRWDEPEDMVEHVEMTFGDDALMMRPVDHPLRRWMASLPK